MAHKTTTSKQVPEAGLFTSIARVQWVAYVSTAWYCSSLYSCYNGRQDTIVKFFNIIYFCVVKSVTLTVCTVHFGPTTYWFTATISGGSLTRGTWLLGTENCTKIIFSVCVYCKLLLVCNYIKKYHIYVVVHQFKDVPATPTEPQCLKMFFTSILKQFVPLTSPPHISTRSFQIRNQLYCTAKKCFYTITTYDVKFQSSITIPGPILCSNSFFRLFALHCRLACHHAGRISSSGRWMIRNEQDQRKTILTKKYSPLLLLFKICFMLVTLYASNEKCNKTYVST